MRNAYEKGVAIGRALGRTEVVAAVEALHRPGNRNPECCTNCGLRCPCPTVRAARSATREAK